MKIFIDTIFKYGIVIYFKICYNALVLGGENMSYNATYSKIYRALLQTSGEFDMKSVMITAYLSSPEHFTKAQIKEIALQVLDDSLHNGMVRMISDGVYESIFSKESQALEDAIKVGSAHNWKDDDSLSRDIRASIFNNQAENEEDILSK